MHTVALNFFPITTYDFAIRTYRFPFVENARPTAGEEQAARRSLVVNGTRDVYWTLFGASDNGTETLCSPFDNRYLTIDALRAALVDSCRRNLRAADFRVFGGFRPHIDIVLNEYTEGIQTVQLEPYFLPSTDQFGLLADFRFHPTEDHRGTRRSLQLSLSLDKHGQPNPNYYADRYEHLVDFVRRFHSTLFPLRLPHNHIVPVERYFVELPSKRLSAKSYIVGAQGSSRSQFMGVKNSGPLERCGSDTHLYFLYPSEYRSLSHDLFRALRGDTFSTFLGMQKMFSLPVSRENVRGAPLEDFRQDRILEIRDRVVSEAAGRNVVPIVLTPFSRHDAPDENAAYWFLKHAFLSAGLPIQVVATDTVADKNKLKWSAASIGLQVFAKAGGTPWKVKPETDRCLIVGIGQAHRTVSNGIDRYFAYSVLTDSSGIFEEIRILGDSSDESTYLETLVSNLHQILSDYSDRFTSFVVHATFSIRRSELERIDAVLDSRRQQDSNRDFVSIKFNDRNKFFGFSMAHNSRIPYESTMVALSTNEFLVWFEGLQYSGSNVRGRIGRPLHVRFMYPGHQLGADKQRAYLQDAINLSGANWRGFNAKSLPISVYYAQIVARYLKEFEAHGLPGVDIQTIRPWFL